MSRYVPFSIGERVVIDDIDCVFDGCVKAPAGSADDDDLVFVDRRTGSRHVFTRQEFDDAYGAGRFRFLKPYERIDDVAPEPDRGDYEKARRRRLWCEAADAAGVARSTKALTAFIAATAPAIPDPNPPSAGSLRRWMSERGFVEDRRPRFMGDRTPRGPREMRVHPMVQRILADGLAEYADKGVRVNQRSVHHKCRAAVIALNAERERQGLPLLDAPSKATVHRYIRAREDREVMVKRWGAKVGGKAALIRGKFTCVRRDRARINFKVTCVKMAHVFAVRAFAVFLIAIGCRYAWEPVMAIVSGGPIPAVAADKISS